MKSLLNLSAKIIPIVLFKFESMPGICPSVKITKKLSYSAGRPTTITDPAGRMLNLAWVGDHLTQITDPNSSPSRVIAFQKDGSWNPFRKS